MVRVSTLMVEDNLADAELLQEELDTYEGASFTIQHVQTLRGACELLDKDRFDLIFLDLSLPDSLGLDTLATIRSRESRVPVIVMTGLDDHEIALYAARMRASNYLVKGGYSLETLKDSIRDALERWAAEGASLRTDEDPIELILAESDLSHRGTRAVDRERALLAAAVSSADDLVIITDRNSVILYVNPAFSRVTGFTQQEALGNNASLVGSGEHDVEFYERMYGQLESEGIWKGEFINRRKSGELVRMDATITCVPGADGEIENYVMVSRDVTALSELQQQLNRTMRLNAIGKLVGGIAHDFNNVLQAVLSYGSVLVERTRTESPELHPYATGVVDAATRAARLTRQLLAFGRSQPLRPEVLDLNDLIAGAADLLKRLLGEDILLELALDRTLPPIEIDPGQVEQIVVNLCVNAREAMPGGGHLRIATTAATLSPDCGKTHGWAEAGDYVLLTVSDTGEGIAPETMDHLFEPFYSTKPEGSGLGLASVYGIVKQHRGLIHCESSPGDGAKFYLYFPVAQVVPVEAPPEPEGGEGGDEEVALSGEARVLVAEDDPTLASIAQMLLEGAGFTVTVARDGEEAWEELCYSVEPFALVLCDMVMPRTGGLELMERVAASPTIHPKPRFLMSSGYNRRLDDRWPGAPSEVEYLQKPYTPAELLLTVRRMLKQ